FHFGQNGQIKVKNPGRPVGCFFMLPCYNEKSAKNDTMTADGSKGRDSIWKIVLEKRSRYNPFARSCFFWWVSFWSRPLPCLVTSKRGWSRKSSREKRWSRRSPTCLPGWRSSTSNIRDRGVWKATSCTKATR